MEKYSEDYMFLYQNSTQEYQTDLEVILDFLEEHYRQESGGKSFWPDARDLCAMPEAVDISDDKILTREHFSHALKEEKAELQISAPAAQQVKAHSSTGNSYPDTETNNQVLVFHNDSNGPVFNTTKGPERPLSQNTTPEKSTKSLARNTTAEKGKKLRLFHFLFEVLEDPKMAHCVSWVPASTGVFRFSARHKERVAQLWGQTKGNRMPMTYQKMSRALRNYAHSGEIFKVKKKLTYQFSFATLITLKSQHSIKFAPYGSN